MVTAKIISLVGIEPGRESSALTARPENTFAISVTMYGLIFYDAKLCARRSQDVSKLLIALSLPVIDALLIWWIRF